MYKGIQAVAVVTSIYGLVFQNNTDVSTLYLTHNEVSKIVHMYNGLFSLLCSYSALLIHRSLCTLERKVDIVIPSSQVGELRLGEVK